MIKLYSGRGGKLKPERTVLISLEAMLGQCKRLKIRSIYLNVLLLKQN